MNMIRHDDVASDIPMRRFGPRTGDDRRGVCVGQNRSAELRAHCDEDDDRHVVALKRSEMRRGLPFREH